MFLSIGSKMRSIFVFCIMAVLSVGYTQAVDQDFEGIATDSGQALFFRSVQLDHLTPEDHQFYKERSRDFGGVRSMFGLASACLVTLKTMVSPDSIFEKYKAYYADKENNVPADKKCNGHWVIEAQGRKIGVLSTSALTHTWAVPDALLDGVTRHDYVELGVNVIEDYRRDIGNAQHLYRNIIQGLHALGALKERPFCDITSEAWVMQAVEGAGAVNRGGFQAPSLLIPFKTNKKHFYIWQ